MIRKSILFAIVAYRLAADTQISTVDTTKGPLVFTWRQLIGGTASFSAGPTADARVSVDTPPLTCTSNARGAANATVQVSLTESGPFNLKANTPRRFLLATHSARPPACVYSGGFLFKDTGGKVIWAPLITVIVPGPEPLFSKFSVTLWRLAPIPSSPLLTRDFQFPVLDRAGLRGLGCHLIGGIRRDAGSWTKVRWKPSTGDPANSDDGLVVDTPPAPGIYTGDLILSDDPAKQTLNLSVNVKDIILWPILVMVIGTWLAFWVKRYVGVRRVTLALRLEEARLGTAFREAQKKFAEAAHGQAFGKYSIAADVEKQRHAALHFLDVVDTTLRTTLDDTDTDYRSAVTTLQSLESAIAAWPDLGDVLSQLSSALNRTRSSIDGNQMEPPNPAPQAPDFFVSAAGLLNGTNITVDKIATIHQKAVDFTATANLWQDLRQKIADLTSEFRGLPPVATGLPQYQQVNDGLGNLWIHLNEAQDVTALNVLAAQNGEIDTIETMLAQILNAVRATPKSTLLPSGRALFFAMAEANIGTAVPALDLLSPANDSRRAQSLKQQIAASDKGAAIFAGLVGLLTGLSTLYFGKPFGTVADYAAVFVWAAGTKVALDMLSGVLDKLTNVNKAMNPQS